MIIHAYFTDGLLNYAKLFLESFKYHNGEKYKIVLTTRDLTPNQIGQIKKWYGNLEIINKPLDYQKISQMSGIPIPQLKKCKREVETGIATEKMKNHVKWKQYISIEDRYRDSVMEVMKKYKNTEDYLVHFDIDMYIRKPLDDLFRIIKQNDFTITFRLKLKSEWQRVFGCLFGIKLDNKGFQFMKEWHSQIDKIPLKRKPFGYGQTSCYYAYKALKNKGFKWGNIPESYIARRINNKKNQNAAIWSGNYVVLGKNKCLELSRKDFNKHKGEKK